MDETADCFNSLTSCATNFFEGNLKLFRATADQILATQYFWNGVLKYLNDFNAPFWVALNSFTAVEKDKVFRTHPWETARDYLELLLFNLEKAFRIISLCLSASAFNIVDFSSGSTHLLRK